MAILEKESLELKSMSLTELRALDPTKSIPEHTSKPGLPGVVPGAPPSLPGVPDMGGGMGMGPPGGGLDDLLGPSAPPGDMGMMSPPPPGPPPPV